MPPAFRMPEPIAVRVSVHSSGRTWTNVRMRYKGNSSLMAATSTGNGKVPFRLDFAPDGKANSSQSFFGFRKLTFSSNFADDSQLREVLATEVLRDRGVPAARAAFYRVVVDTGEGARYWGLYTMVEDPSDGAMLDAQLGGRGANLYKPDGPAASWTRFDSASFEKKTNEGAKDFGDVMAAINALHSEMTDRSAWRAKLERVFDVDLFLLRRYDAEKLNRFNKNLLDLIKSLCFDGKPVFSEALMLLLLGDRMSIEAATLTFDLPGRWTTSRSKLKDALMKAGREEGARNVYYLYSDALANLPYRLVSDDVDVRVYPFELDEAAELFSLVEARRDQ